VRIFAVQRQGWLLILSCKRVFVFDLKRGLKTSFVFSLLFSIGGIFLGASIIYLLTLLAFFAKYPIVAKCIAIGVTFFYNYETKKIAFGDR